MNIVQKRKEIFIAMAEQGLNKPSVKTKMGRMLRQYLKDDIEFKKEIYKHPEWQGVFEKAKSRREQIIEIALEKEGKKPKHNSTLGRTLRRCTSKNNKLYKPKFDKIIRKLKPQWFVNKGKLISIKLINLAKNNHDRPQPHSKLGKALNRRLKNKKFYEIIKNTRPDWIKEFISWEELLQQVAQSNFELKRCEYLKNKKYNWPSDPKRKYKQFRNWRIFWANVKKIKRETHIESTEHNHG